MNDPVGDAVRSVVDGHVVLSRDLANRGHYPAIDVPASVSRVMKDVVEPEKLRMSRKVKEVLATYQDAADLISIGAYVDGTDPKIDYAKRMIGPINEFLRQEINEKVAYQPGFDRLKGLLKAGDETV